MKNFSKMCGDMCTDFMETSGMDNQAAAYETVRIRKTDFSCSLCEDYVKHNSTKPVAIISCEGACLRGEISRRIANIISNDLIPDKTVRICAGSAFTKDSGQRNLVRNAKKVVVLEGCPTNCGSRTLNGVIPDFNPQVIHTDSVAQFDKGIFGINDLPSAEIDNISRKAAEEIVTLIK